MEWFHNLFFGNSSFWGGGVAHSVLILALVIALGIALGKLKIGGIRLGVTVDLFSSESRSAISGCSSTSIWSISSKSSG